MIPNTQLSEFTEIKCPNCKTPLKVKLDSVFVFCVKCMTWSKFIPAGESKENLSRRG